MKTQLIWIVLALAFVVVGLKAFTSTAAVPETTLEQIERTGAMTVCYVELPPTIMKDPQTGQFSGVLVDMAEHLAESMEVDLRYQQSTWGTFPADLNSRRCDLSIAATFKTIPRAKAIAYSETIAVTGNSALVKQGSGLENTASIMDFDKKGVTVAVLNGEQGHEFVKQHFTQAEIKVVQGSDDTLPFLEVLAGRADVGLHESVVVGRFVEEHPELVDVFAENPYNPVQIAWAMRSDDSAFQQFISTALDVMETSGKLDEFIDAYDLYWVR